MNNKKKYELSPKGFDHNSRNEDEKNGVYSMPYEEACSAEFTEGCIIRYNLSE